MLTAFTKLRRDLLRRKGVGLFILAALGEALLVVGGILLALRIDAWDDARSDDLLREQYRSALIADLTQDTLTATGQINLLHADLTIMQGLSGRLSRPGATVDSVRQIARYEFVPFFDPSHELNVGTATALLSTGDIRLFDVGLRDALLAHGTYQAGAIRVLDENVDILLTEVGRNQLPRLEVEISLGPVEALSLPAIRGELLDRVWASIPDEALVADFNRLLTTKLIYSSIVAGEKQRLIERTRGLLTLLEASGR